MVLVPVDIDAAVGHARRVNWACVRRLLALSAVVGLGLLGCTVEPKVYEFPPLDAGPRADATVDAGAPTCLDGQVRCKDTEYCDEAGACLTKPTTCTIDGDCRGGEACAIPLAPTSSTTPGRCAAPSWRCDPNGTGCEGRCTDLGYCAPAATNFQVNANLAAIVPRCSAPTDCGAGGRCVDGACARCATNADCGGLICDDGRCVEGSSCGGESACYEANRCANGVCVRIADACTPDPADDTREGAVQLRAAHYTGRSVCGREVDWYRLDLADGEGATLAFTGARSGPHLVVTVTDASGAAVDHTILDLPGLLAIRVPVTDPSADGRGRSVYFEVGSDDVSGAYELTVERTRGLCAGDALDLYGDDTAARALIGPSGASFERRHCPGGVDQVGVALEIQDQLRPSAETTTYSDLVLSIRDGSGADVTVSSTRSPSGDGHLSQAIGPRAASAGPGLVQVQANLGPSAGLGYTLHLSRALGARAAVCQAPEELSLPIGGAQITAELSTASDLGAPTCTPDPFCSGDNCARYAAATRPERLFRITPAAAPAILTVEVHPDGPEGQLALALLDRCDDDQSASACDRAPLPGRAVPLEVQLSSTTPVFLLVSGDDVDRFTLQAQLTLVAPPSNDACADAAPLTTSGTAVVSTYGARDDVQLGTNSAACSAATVTGLGLDRFYLLDLGAGERAAVELTGPRGGLLWAGRSCLNLTVTCTAAVALDFSNPVARATFEPAEATAYFVAVDGLTSADLGTYQLRTVREPELECLDDADCTRPLRCDDYRCVPVPSNDACPGTRIDLTSNRVQITGSTGAANDDLVPSCTGGTSPDVVYRIPVPAGLSELVVRITEARFDPALAVRFEQCTSAIDERCNDDVRFPDVLLPEVRIPQPEGGTYYVVVDAFAGEGTFTLEVEAIP